jgi:hypothetical protein
VLSCLHQIPVYAVDSQATNTAGAAGRANNLGRKWTSLQIRAAERAEGAAVPRSRQQCFHGDSDPDPGVFNFTRIRDLGLGRDLTVNNIVVEPDS